MNGPCSPASKYYSKLKFILSSLRQVVSRDGLNSFVVSIVARWFRTRQTRCFRWSTISSRTRNFCHGAVVLRCTIGRTMLLKQPSSCIAAVSANVFEPETQRLTGNPWQYNSSTDRSIVWPEFGRSRSWGILEARWPSNLSSNFRVG